MPRFAQCTASAEYRRLGAIEPRFAVEAAAIRFSCVSRRPWPSPVSPSALWPRRPSCLENRQRVIVRRVIAETQQLGKLKQRESAEKQADHEANGVLNTHRLFITILREV